MLIIVKSLANITIFKIKSEIAQLQTELKEIEQHPKIKNLKYAHLELARAKSLLRRGISLPTDLNDVYVLLTKKEDLILTIAHLRYALDSNFNSQVESDGMMSSDMSCCATEVNENLKDGMGDSKQAVSDDGSKMLNVGQTELLSMSKYLSRPVMIANTTVALDSALEMKIDVWNQFLLQPSVRAKLRNYAYLNGDLHIRIVVSATPWHYGKLLVSYQPLAGYNSNLTEFFDFNLSGTYREHSLIYLSQSKNSATMDIKDNQPLELKCSFISPKPAGRLFNSSTLVIGDTTPFDDFDDFGSLYILSMGNISAINASATPMSIQIYAWMEEVKLGVPTATLLSAAVEADGSIGDSKEMKVGPLEKISTKMAGIASVLSDVPIIGPFAKAAEMPLKLFSGAMAAFGFSYPTTINHVSRMKNEPYQNMSQVIGMDSGHRITLDPKQELSVDPRAAGSDKDEMAFSHLCSTESLLTHFTWSPEDVQFQTTVFSYPVNPTMIYSQSLSGDRAIFAPTPLSFVGYQHEYWRGDITYRFEVICSQFHRGTLLFYYEPNLSQSVAIDASPSLNKQFIHKVDIQSSQDFEITINWASPFPWLHCFSSDDVHSINGEGLSSVRSNYANGYIKIIPFTSLQSPDGSSIRVNVYVKSHNMHFNQYIARMPAQRPSVESDGFMTDTGHSVMNTTLNPTTATDSHINTFNFGEEPLSFRALLRRFSTWDDYKEAYMDPPWNAGVWHFNLRMWSPSTPSYRPLSSLSKRNLFGYLRSAYLGFRGGIKKRVSAIGPCTQNTLHPFFVHLLPPNRFITSSLVNIEYLPEFLDCSGQGSAMFVPHTNGGVEFEIPFYTINSYFISFNDGDQDEMPNIPLLDRTMSTGVMIATAIDANPAELGTAPLTPLILSAIGEDFSFMRFSGAPPFVDFVLPI